MMEYEPGMQIIFDVIGKRATIIFRGSLIDLPGPFSTQSEAVLAGEQKCRELGWMARANDNEIDVQK